MAGPFVDPFPFEPFGQGNGSHDFSNQQQQQQQQQYDLFSHLTVNHGQLPPFPGDVAGGTTDSPPLTGTHAPFHRPLAMPGVDIDMDTMDMDLLLSLPTSLPTTTTTTTAPLPHHHQPATWPDHPPADSPPWQNHQQPQLHQQQPQQLQHHPSPDTHPSPPDQTLAPKLALALRDRDAALVALSALQNQVYAARQLEKRLRAERDDARSQAAFLRKERTAGRATEARLRRERNQARVQVAVLRGGYHGKGGGGKGRSLSSGVAGGLEAVLGGFRGKGGQGGGGGGEGGEEVVLQGERIEEILREVSPGLLYSPLEGEFTSLSE